MITLNGHVALIQPRVGIGDMVWHLPTLRALAQHAIGPVTLIARPRSHADQLLGIEDGIDDVFWLERDQWEPDGRHQGMRGMARLVADLRGRQFDTAVLLTRSRNLAFAAAAAGIPARFGYGIGLQRLLLRPPALPMPHRTRHPFDQAVAWMAEAGLPLEIIEPRITVKPSALASARKRLDLNTGPVIALGIAASDSWKCWSPTHFAGLATALLYQGWPALVLLGGANDRAATGAIVAELSPADAARVIPVLGWHLGEVAAMLQDAAFYVGNDTAVLNIAAAVGTRAYGLFGATPALHHSHNIITIVPPGGPNQTDGMLRITVRAVLEAIAAERPMRP